VGSGGAAGPLWGPQREGERGEGRLGRTRGEGAGWAEKGRKGEGDKKRFSFFLKPIF
jgi:hypothetical protein